MAPQMNTKDATPEMGNSAYDQVMPLIERSPKDKIGVEGSSFPVISDREARQKVARALQGADEGSGQLIDLVFDRIRKVG